jgi:hypothetical protein
VHQPGPPGQGPAIFANTGLPAPADYQPMTVTLRAASKGRQNRRVYIGLEGRMTCLAT